MGGDVGADVWLCQEGGTDRHRDTEMLGMSHGERVRWLCGVGVWGCGGVWINGCMGKWIYG